MASPMSSLLFISILIISSINAQTGLILPITKDPTSSQFFTTFQMGSNPTTINAVINLAGRALWIACDNYTSSTYSTIPCASAECESIRQPKLCSYCFGPGPARPGCMNDTCVGFASENPNKQYIIYNTGFYRDTLSLNHRVVLSGFVFSCAPNYFLEELAGGATGMLGLAMNSVSIHRQVAASLKSRDRFSICLPSSGPGKLSIGIEMSEKSDISVLVKSTSLIINPVSTAQDYRQGDASEEYFIGVESVRVAGEGLSARGSYFSIDKNGVGGTKISTVQVYTSLHTSIYKSLARAFDKAAAEMKIRGAAAVAPFKDCYRSETVFRTAAGPDVPVIDLVFPGKDVYWRITGANSMVEIDRNTMCLGFLDAGSRPRTAIVIGVHQLEENLMEFDLGSMQLKFTSSLLVHNKSCSRI